MQVVAGGNVFAASTSHEAGRARAVRASTFCGVSDKRWETGAPQKCWEASSCAKTDTPWCKGCTERHESQQNQTGSGRVEQQEHSGSSTMRHHARQRKRGRCWRRAGFDLDFEMKRRSLTRSD